MPHDAFAAGDRRGTGRPVATPASGLATTIEVSTPRVGTTTVEESPRGRDGDHPSMRTDRTSGPGIGRTGSGRSADPNRMRHACRVYT